jgi:hypothetical protein
MERFAELLSTRLRGLSPERWFMLMIQRAL